MHVAAHDFDQLLREHGALLRAYRDVQARCGAQLLAQARDLARLDAQVMRLRAALIARDTALAWAREDREELERSIPGLPRRVALARRVTELQARLQDLARARAREAAVPPAPCAGPDGAGDAGIDPHLEASLTAADLVICQAGCMSHGAYWRVRDHCQRTGKACVLVDQPDALRIVRIRRSADRADAAGGGVESVTAHPGG